MGLEVSAYGNIKKIEKLKDIQDFCINVFKNGFDEQFGNLEEGYYSFEDYCPIEFYSGYKNYSNLREELCEILNIPEYSGDINLLPYYDRDHLRQAFICHTDLEYKDYPLLYLIHFSDCEGFICNEICNKIAEDFKNIKVEGKLQKLKDIFIWASENNGIVSFH